MKNLFNLIIFITLCAAFQSCKETSIQPIEIIDVTETIDESEFIIIAHGEVLKEQENSIRSALMNNSKRIREHLTMSSMPVITVEVWAQSSSSSFYNVMQNRIGQIYQGATGFTPSFTEMFMLYNPTTPTETVHEYAHLVSMKLNPTISNNPRWLWEAVAQYESGMYSHPSTWNPLNIEFPGFNALNQYNSVLPYRWGYFISACIIENWGNDKFVEMIKQNGDIQKVVGVSSTEFANMIELFVKNMRN